MEKQINEKKALVPKAFLCYKLIKRTPSYDLEYFLFCVT